MLDATALMGQAQDAYAAGMQNKFSHLNGGKGKMTEEQAYEAGKQFEAFFIGQMFEYMNTDLDGGSSYFGGGHAEEMWRSMLNQEYGKEVAKSNSLGIAESVMRSLIQVQSDATAGNKAPPMAAAPKVPAVDPSTLNAPAAVRTSTDKVI